jgi:enoyl-CoA hydratase/carnithine racemase
MGVMVQSADPQSEGRIRTEIDEHIFVVTIDRPQKYNGFTPEMVVALSEAYTAYEANSELWCLVLQAAGDHFTAGLQLDRFEVAAPLVPPDLIDPLDLLHPRRTKPVVAAVKGICFTIGIELMLAADCVVAEEGTRFGQLEVKRGLMAYGGATMRMVERAGWGNAMRYLLTGDEFDAATALRVGFVQEVVPKGQADARARALAETIARQAPLAVQATRLNARVFAEHGTDAAVADLRGHLPRIAASEDFAEGVASFKERRNGVYRGR